MHTPAQVSKALPLCAKTSPIAAFVLACGLAIFGPTGLHGSPAGRPNVILILTDDQGYGDVGFNGNPMVRTPTLDRYAGEGVVFDRFYAHPVCSPTRASLMTGRYPFRTGVTDTEGGASILRPSENTIAEILQSHGYKTGLFGKWHLGDNAPGRPIDQGFDQYLTHVGGMIGAPYSPLEANSYFDPVLLENGNEKKFEGYCMDIFTDEAIKFIKSAEGSPFFLFFAPNTPHHPLTVADRYAAPYRERGLSEDTALYYGMISNLDDNFKRLTDALEQLGEAENTVIIFLGDNGTSSLHKQSDLWESGLRGRKTFVYENGIRVPMFVHFPGQSATARRLTQPAAVEDILPTLLDYCGLQQAPALDGRSLLPLLGQEVTSLPNRKLYFQFHRGAEPELYRNIAVIDFPFKLVQPTGRGATRFSREAMEFELYDLQEDPFEKTDIAAKHPQVIERLKASYQEWFEEVTKSGFAPVPTWIGDDQQGKVRLSRQDWRGGGLDDGELGVYEIDVRKAGNFRITCHWSALLDRSHPTTLRIGDQILTKNILYAEAQARFETVFLPAGLCQLEAWIEFADGKKGFRFIDIERISDLGSFETDRKLD